jgi:hypothetical protein
MPSSSGWFCLTVVSFALVAAMAMTQGATGSATGTPEIAKERFSLKHAFAVMERDPFSEGEKENLVVLLSDVAVPDAMRRPPNDWRIWVSDQAGAGAIHGLIVTISPRRKFCGQRQRRHQTGWGLMF